MKQHERMKARDILSCLGNEQIEKLSDKVSSNIVYLISEIHSKDSLLIGQSIIGAYVPIQSEVRWFNNFSLDFEYSIALPHLENDTSMQYYFRKLEDIKSNQFGLRLKLHNNERVEVPNVILVPGLAFTKDGLRLGRGKGFFDRYLASFNGVKIGVGFECQVFEDLTQEKFDIKMDYLVTDKNIYKGKNK